MQRQKGVAHSTIYCAKGEAVLWQDFTYATISTLYRRKRPYGFIHEKNNQKGSQTVVLFFTWIVPINSFKDNM